MRICDYFELRQICPLFGCYFDNQITCVALKFNKNSNLFLFVIEVLFFFVDCLTIIFEINTIKLNQN